MRLAVIDCVVPDGPGLSAPCVAIEWPEGSDVDIPVRVLHADGTPYVLGAGMAAVLAFRLYADDVIPLVAREWTPTGSNTALFQVLRGDRGKLPSGSYVAGIEFIDNNTAFEDEILGPSRVSISQPIASFTDPITVLPPQVPLAKGDTGPQGPPVPLSDDLPLVNGTAATGESSDAPRSDHVHPIADTIPTYNARMVVRGGVILLIQEEEATATFDVDGSSQVAVTWPSFGDRPFKVHQGAPVSDAIVVPNCYVIAATITPTGCTIQAQDSFTGTVPITVRET